MAEISLPWNGTTIGDAAGLAPYDAPSTFAIILGKICGEDGYVDLGGIVRSYATPANELLATGSVSPVSIAAGSAVVFGTVYNNSAPVSIAVPSPTTATRQDLIVLRKSWAAQTVRLTRIAGAEGGGVPAKVQVSGTTWDLPLWQLSVTTGGAITLTDLRQVLFGNLRFPTITAPVITNPTMIGAWGSASQVGVDNARPLNWVKMSPAGNRNVTGLTAGTQAIPVPHAVPQSAILISANISFVVTTGAGGTASFGDAASVAVTRYSLVLDVAGTVAPKQGAAVLSVDPASPDQLISVNIAGTGTYTISFVVDAYAEYM